MTSPATAQTPEQRVTLALFGRRILAIFLRHMYLYIGSWPRLVQMMYWPAIGILVWGFTSFYILKQWTNSPIILDSFVGGGLLNEVFVRTCLTMTVLFLEEIWSRNLGHLFASPLRFLDYTIGVISTALVCVVIGVIPAMLIARWLFDFSILSFGPMLVPMIGLLVLNGCWFGFVILAMLFRYGLAAEWLGWMLVFLLPPFIAPYYPVSILPHALQTISWCLPATYVFEFMRDIINHRELQTHYLWISLALNLIYLAGASFVLYRAYRSAQKRGGILQVGE